MGLDCRSATRWKEVARAAALLGWQRRSSGFGISGGGAGAWVAADFGRRLRAWWRRS
jgi:hypothetical protein